MTLVGSPTFPALDEFLQTPLFTISGSAVTVGLVVRIVLAVVAVAVLAKLVSRWLVPRIFRRSSVDPGVQDATARIAGYVVWVIGALICLPLAGIPVNSVVLAFSALGVGLGFGLQNIADNFVSGLILLFERPVKVGDRIQVGSLYGTIREIRARATVVETNENVSIIVPNSELISKDVTNLTHNGPMIRFRFPVGVSYSSDVEVVRQTLIDVAKQHPAVLEKPEPEALFMGFGDSSLDFVLRVAAASSTHQPDILTSDMYYAIWHAFKAKNIEIPFPQRDLHVRSFAPEVVEQLGPSTTRRA